MRRYESLSQVQHENQLWFSHSSMEAFNSIVESDLIDGRFFVTSERREKALPKRFTIRKVASDIGIATIGKFQQYKSLKGAVAGITAIIDSEKV